MRDYFVSVVSENGFEIHDVAMLAENAIEAFEGLFYHGMVYPPSGETLHVQVVQIDTGLKIRFEAEI